MAMSTQADYLLDPQLLYSASEIASRPCPVPATAGVYAFYFDVPPPGVETRNCHRHGAHTLLYVGIAPRHALSKSHLRRRLRTHYGGNAAGSTLRRTLGCLLGDQLAIQLRRVG